MTGTELEPRHLPAPVSGEAIDLAGPTPDLARWVDALRDLRSQASDAIKTLSAEIVDRGRNEATGTVREGGWTLQIPLSPTVEEWDAEHLYRVLSNLVEQGLVTSAWRSKAVQPVTSYKVDKRGVDALRKQYPDLCDRIEQAMTVVPVESRVTIKGRPA